MSAWRCVLSNPTCFRENDSRWRLRWPVASFLSVIVRWPLVDLERPLSKPKPLLFFPWVSPLMWWPLGAASRLLGWRGSDSKHRGGPCWLFQSITLAWDGAEGGSLLHNRLAGCQRREAVNAQEVMNWGSWPAHGRIKCIQNMSPVKMIQMCVCVQLSSVGEHTLHSGCLAVFLSLHTFRKDGWKGMDRQIGSWF